MSCQSSNAYIARDDSSTSVITYKPEALKELGKALDKPETINILIDSNDDKLYHLTGYGLTVIPGFRFGSISRWILFEDTTIRTADSFSFARFEKNSIPGNLIQAAHDAQMLAKKLGSDHTDLDSVSFTGLGCDDGDFYSVTIESPLIYLINSSSKEVFVKINSPITSNFPINQNDYWHAFLTSSGTIQDYKGTNYQYIPYEFLRRDFKRPAQGFVVDKEHYISFLKDNLWKSLGLTDSEIADYWKDLEWRIPKSPYYFVSLIDRSEIDRVLPMEVNPKPDTTIRNMTYILPLSSPFIPIPLSEDKLKAPERKGFTVLENGGFIDGF